MKPEEKGRIRPTPASKAQAAQQAEAALALLSAKAADVARRLVAMHWFNADVIAALLPEGTPEEERMAVVTAITALPFVEVVPQGHAYQPLVRQGLLERYQEERPEDLKAACKAAATALTKGWEDDSIAQEMFYCLMVTDERKDAQNRLHELLERFLERQDWERCSALYATLAEAEGLSFARTLPRTSDYYLLRGMARGAQGKWVLAQKGFNQALERQPTLAWAVAQRGEAHARMGHDDAALADMARAAFMDRRSVDALAMGGSLNRLVDEYQRDPAAFPQAKMGGPGKLAEGLGALGERARLEGRNEDALAYFQRALALIPDLAWVYASRGVLYMSQECPEEALAEINRAIELDPNYAWALLNRGRVYRFLDRDEEALADINRALQIEPKMSGAFAERGEIHRKHGRLDEALEDFEQALRLNSLNAWAAARRGQVLKAKGRYLDALAEMHRAIALSSKDDAWSLTTRGELHVHFENWPDALSDFSRAIELEPDNAEAIADRAQVYQELERY
ncbi:MAG: tetratricopeptide repeat protein, partial [Actinobacteria bacterium]|nr:tetratricopeptide repeat protein [Actinomycetota bacterium]